MKHVFTELQLKWLEALESGKYKQGRFRLKNDSNGQDTYCCLGVACEVAGIKPVLVDNARWEYEEMFSVPPDRLVSELGLNDMNGMIMGEGCLINMNDSGSTFAEIAQFIRENPERVFKTELT